MPTDAPNWPAHKLLQLQGAVALLFARRGYIPLYIRPEGAEKVSYKLEIERLLFEKKQEYIDLRDILTAIQHVQGTVETREIIRYKDEDPFTIVKTFGGAILDGNEFEMKAEEKTVHKLNFICSSKDETIE